MANGPVANYVYKPWRDRPGKPLGFSAVGPGWRSILDALDSMIANTLENAKVKCEFEVVQIKEKFGGLRVYWSSEGLDERSFHLITGATRMAENMSYRTCEKCGSHAGAETRMRGGQKYSRTLTLCAKCHEERDNLPTGERFEFGNGDWTA